MANGEGGKMPGDSQLYVSGTSRIRFTEEYASSSTSPASYWLLLAFLILLYANLPFVLPATEVVHPAKIVAGAAVLMLLVETMTGRRHFELAWPEGCWLLLFLGAAALSCFTALWPGHAAEALSDLVKMVLSFFFVVNCANTKKRLRGVMWTMLAGAILPAIGTLRNYSNGQLFEGRASWVGIFANPNEVAYSLVILIPIAAALASRLRVIPRVLVLGLCLLYLGAIFVTFSRGGYVGLGVAIALYAWRKRSLWLQAAVVCMVLVAIGIGSRYWSRSEDFSNLQGDVSFRQRVATSEAGVNMFMDHPLLGVGLGCSVVAWPLYAPKDLYSRSALVTHNTIIQPLAETGLAGFIPFMVVLGIAAVSARKLALRSTDPEMQTLGGGLEAATWGFIVCGLSGGYVVTWFPYLLLGLVSAARRIRGED